MTYTGVYCVKGVKTFDGHEGRGYNANLYRDNKKVASVINEGNGGCPFIYWVRPKDKVEVEVEWAGEKRMMNLCRDEAAMQEHCKSLPPEPSGFGTDLEITPDFFIDLLIEEYEENRELRRWCKNSVVYRLRGKEKGTWGIEELGRRKWQPALAVVLALEFLEQLEEVANLRFAG